MTELQNNPATEQKDPAQIDYERGLKLLDGSNIAEAAVEFHNALMGFEEAGNEKGIANATDKLGDVCLAKEDYEGAITHFGKTYALCEKEDDEFSMMSIQRKIAEARKGLKQYEQVIEIYLGLIDTYFHYNSPSGAVDILDKLSDVYVSIGDKEKAVDALKTAASIHKNFKHESYARKFMERAEALNSGQ